MIEFNIKKIEAHTMKNMMHSLSQSCAIIALCAFAQPAFAQPQTEHPKGDQSKAEHPKASGQVEIDEIVVTGFRASLQRALSIKQEATGISDSITAEDIGKFPDANISESLQRVPGVTLNRNSFGEGQQINLRGLGPDFTLVEVNGLAGTSNNEGGRFGRPEGGGGRGFSFEIFPAELFTRVDISKTALPSQIEGGLAGVVSLQTPRPLDQQEGVHASASAMGDYSELNEKIDPRGALLLSYKKNDMFGISGSVAYSDKTLRSNTAEGGTWRAFSKANTGPIQATDPAVLDALNANGPRYYYFSAHRKTLGTTLTLQAKPSDQLEINVDGMYGQIKEDRHALRDDMAIEGGSNAPTNYTIENGVITQGDFTHIQQRIGANYYTTDEKFKQVSGKVDWMPNENWTITPMVGYTSRHTARTYDLYSFRLADSAGEFDPGTVSYNVRGDFLDFGSTATDFMSNPEDFLFNVFLFRPSKDKDDEFSTKLDFERTSDTALASVKFGVRYSDRLNQHDESQRRLQRTASVSTLVPPSLADVGTLVDFSVRGSMAPDQLLDVDEDAVRSVFLPDGLDGTPVDGTYVREMTAFAGQVSYKVKEKTFAAYAQAEFDVDNFKAVAGVRYIHTKQVADAFSVANAYLPSEQITPVSTESTYSYFLPSMTARWEVVPNVIVRAAYGRTLTRPNLGSVSPSETVTGIDESGGRGTKGNPDLKPYTADNIDLGVEWYFSKDGLIGGNVFYKDIKGYIDTQSFVEDRTYPRQADAVLVTGPISFTQPVNGVSASIKGFELTAQSRLGVIAEALQDFGFVVNYSYTESSADFGTEGDVRSQGLPGLSKNSYNLTAYYDNGTFDARFSYSWRGRYLAQFNDDFGVPRFTTPYGQLDFSANYDINDNVSVQLQALNLTRSQSVNKSSSLYLPYNVAELDRRVLIGVRAKF